MHNFDVILGMDWLETYHATMHCFSKTITFKLKGEQADLMIQGNKKKTRAQFILRCSRLLLSELNHGFRGTRDLLPFFPIFRLLLG